jgi:phosphoribosyl 1,2-cyclic phosphodiesterase
MVAEKFIVRFWGTRGSYPVPGIGTVRYGGNTPCVELQVGKHSIILDAGTGIINLGYDLMRRAQEQGGFPIIATILLTHLHHDHTQGFPFFMPVMSSKSILHILGPHTFEQKLEEELSNIVLTPNFPVNMVEMPSFKIIHTLRATESLIFGPEPSDLRICNVYHDQINYTPDHVRVSIHKGYAHPKNGVYIYRIEWRGKSVVFASDTEGYIDTDQRLVAFARNTDLLIHDAQYTQDIYLKGRQGWGHSTIEMACEVARQSATKQLILFHHDPAHNDEKIDEMEKEAQKLFPNAIAAYEGLEISLM